MKINQFLISLTVVISSLASFAERTENPTTKNKKRDGQFILKVIKTEQMDKEFVTADQCGLKKFSLIKQDYQAHFSDDPSRSENTGVYAFYETTDKSCIRDYAIVQYIKGCALEYFKDKNGKIIKRPMLYQSRNKNINFYLPEWIVDSVDVDPMYSSTDAADHPDRHAVYKTPKKKINLIPANMNSNFNYCGDSANRFYFYENQAVQPELAFVSDYPTGANIDNSASYFREEQAVLDLKLCIYKTNDVPLIGDPKSFDVPASEGGPLYCFDWQSNHTYDRVNKKFQKATSTAAFCSFN